MNLSSLLNTFGLGSQNDNDPSLGQGRQLIDFNQTYTKQIGPQLKQLQETGIPGVSSITEAMDASKPNVGVQTRKADQVSELEDQFSKKLAEYNAAYKLFSEAVVKTNTADKEIQQYFGQVVTSGDGNYSYVNDYGYTHKYSTDAWSNNADSCPQDALSIDQSLASNMKSGPEMGSGQPCGIAGSNIQNDTTKEYAWVDIKGYKHVYSSDLWASKSASCDVPAIVISDSEYKAIPSGGNITSTDKCLQIDIDPALWNKIMSLNDELLVLSEKLAQQLGKLVVQDVELQVALKESQKELAQTNQSLQSDRSALGQYQTTIVTAGAEEEDTALLERMRYLQLLAWMFLLVTILSLTAHAFVAPASKVSDIIGLIFGILLLFVISKWLWNKYRK
jgi:hypothetical protein